MSILYFIVVNKGQNIIHIKDNISTIHKYGIWYIHIITLNKYPQKSRKYSWNKIVLFFSIEIEYIYYWINRGYVIEKKTLYRHPQMFCFEWYIYVFKSH